MSPGRLTAILARVVEGLRRARRERIEILCFSECFLTGYWNRAAAHLPAAVHRRMTLNA